MSDDQIASALGQIIGKLDTVHDEFKRYVDLHDDRHTKIDTQLQDHAANINQAKGAKGAVLAMATGVSVVVGAAIAAIGKLWK